MKLLLSLGLVLLFFLPAGAAQRNFSWLPNTDHANGYNLHWGYESGVYIDIQDVGFPDPVDGRIHGTLDNLPEEGRTLYFAATAYDDSGDEVYESDYSVELSDFIPIPPPPPDPILHTPIDIRAEEVPI